MTDKIPEALAVLDAGIGALQVCGVKTDAIEQARTALSELIEAARDVTSELTRDPEPDTPLARLDEALAAVEKLP